jgi:hypothetical protein
MKKLLIMLTFATTAFAGNGAISLSPAVVMLRGNAGESASQTWIMRNGTSRAMSFDVVAQDVVIDRGTRVMKPAGSIAGSIAATAVFSAKHVTVPAGESTAVTVTVTVPPNASQRAVVTLFRGTDTIMRDKMPTTASVGALMTFALSNDVAMSATPLVVRPQSATANLAVSHICTNTGREPLVARGMLAIIGADGKLAGKAPLTPRRLLPGERAQLGAEYAGEIARGHYRLLLTYDYEGRTLTQSAEVDVR